MVETKFGESASRKFIVWSKKNGVSFKHSDDWKPWWECWADGYKTRCEEENLGKAKDIFWEKFQGTGMNYEIFEVLFYSAIKKLEESP